jgi:hypothetical protein
MGHGKTPAQDTSAERIIKLSALLNAIVTDDKLYETCPYCRGPKSEPEKCPMAIAHDFLYGKLP